MGPVLRIPWESQWPLLVADEALRDADELREEIPYLAQVCERQAESFAARAAPLIREANPE